MSSILQPLLQFTGFAQPGWLLAGLAAVIALPLLYLWHDGRQRRALAAFAVEREQDLWGLGVSQGLTWLRRGCVTLAALCGFAALAQPQGAPQFRTEQDRGIDILFVIDTSRSMLTPDVRPDRLTRARLAVEDLLEQLGGDAVGLVAFAGQAFLMAPLTTDHDAFRETLEALDTHSIPVGGTDIAAAIHLAQSTFLTHRDADPVVVLITDGEDLGGEAMAAARAAGKAGIRIYTIGVGTSAGDLIPVTQDDGSQSFVRDPDGNLVKSRLDEAALRQIAAATGGTYQPLGAQGQGVTQLYQRTLSGLARQETTGRQVEVHAQLFQWPLGLGLFLLLVDWLVRPIRHYATGTVLVAATLAALLLSIPVPPAQAADALGQYRDGAQAYRGQDYEAAVKAYRGALQTTDVPLQQNAYYNLGNALYREGSAAGRDPQQAIQNLRQAVSAYDAALQLKPADADARFNRSVAQKKLDALQRQEQQKQQPQQQQQSRSNPKQDSQQQGGRSQQDQEGQQSPQGQPQGQSQNQPQNQPRNQQQGEQQNPQHSSQGGQPRNPPDTGPGQSQDQNQNQNQNQNPGQGQAAPRPAAAGPSAGSAPQSLQAGQSQPHVPGEMTREEAERLLDSVRGQERRVVSGGTNNPSNARPSAPLKDW